MKALSIRQPWAWLIVNGWKDIENREWYSSFKGRVYVHAGKTMTKADYEACVIFCSGLDLSHDFEFPEFAALERGGIVGAVDVFGCTAASSSQWFVGPYGFQLRNPEALPFQGCKGALGFFEPQLLTTP